MIEVLTYSGIVLGAFLLMGGVHLLKQADLMHRSGHHTEYATALMVGVVAAGLGCVSAFYGLFTLVTIWGRA